MLTALIAIIMFCLLVTVHEFGHFFTAKLSGVTVHEFAIGMGPAIFKKQRGETLYSIRIIPLGGYCKMEGEDSESEAEGSFNNTKPWQKIIILASGAIMNLLLGYLIFLIIMFQAGSVAVPIVKNTMDGYPAAQVLQEGDEIQRINGRRIYTNSELATELARTGSAPTELVISRNGKTSEITITPKNDDENRLLLGIMVDSKKLTFANRFFYAYRSTFSFSKLILVSFGDLITGRVGLNQLSGPAGIVSEIGNAASASQQQRSLVPLLSFMAFITINLGVFNLLPIPALDGGRIFFVLVGLIIRRKIPPEKEGIVHLVGLVLLFGLIIYATGNDLIRIFS